GGDGGPSGPAGAGPTGEGQSARPAGDGEHDSNANRTRIVVEPERPRFGEIFEISRGLKGFGLLVAPFIGLDLAEHEGLITPDQKTGFIATLMAGLTYLDRMTPAHLLLLYSPFELGRMGTEAGLEATGVEKGSRTHKVGGTVGAFAAAEGFVMAVGKGAGAQTLKEAHSLGRKVMHDAATTGIRNIATGLNTVFAQAAQIGRQAVQFGRQVVQTARQIAPAGPMMIAPAVAALKGGAVVAAASTAVVAGAVGAAGLGAAYLTYRSGVGEGIADKTSNRWIEKKIYDWFLD
ncbi:MAG: hypothetical protein HY609_01255, partial [Deltaproteobacteria bacterium]|nr:hypothetical protein [Deltaproteobacteria bacterium]